MKKRFLFTAFMILSVTMIIAQQTRFPIKPGSAWRINYEYYSNCSDGEFIHLNGDEEYEYFIDGDTVIGTRNYFQLYKTGIMYLDTPFGIKHKYTGAIRDSADKFYYLADEEQNEKLLYDFAVDVGDTIQMEGTGMRYPVDEIITLESGRKQYRLSIISAHCGSADTFIEGIGWLGGLLEGNSCSGHPGVRGSYLVCYSEDDQIIYQNPQTRCGKPLKCEDIVVSSDDVLSPIVAEITVLPGNKLSIIVPDDERIIYDIRIFSVMGKLEYQKESELPVIIDISALTNGVYLLRLSNKEGSNTIKFTVQST